MPWDTAGHLGESRAKTGEAKQPRLRNRLRDRRMRALGWARGRGWSMEAPSAAPDAAASRFRSEPGEPSRATLMGEGQTVLLGRRMKRPGEGKGLPGERQLGEKGLEGDGGTQVPVYTARWGLGAKRWPGCREGERRGVRARLPRRRLPPPTRPLPGWSPGPLWLPLGTEEGCPEPPRRMARRLTGSPSPGRLPGHPGGPSRPGMPVARLGFPLAHQLHLHEHGLHLPGIIPSPLWPWCHLWSAGI